MDNFSLPLNPQFNRQIFNGTATADGVDGWQTWIKPRGKSQVVIFTIGGGGGGGQGVIGAVSTAAGGGGGGSGAQTIVQIPADMLPDMLYVQAGQGKTGAGIHSRVAVAPNTVATNQVTVARAGAVGGNASGATAGTGGAGGAVTTAADCPYFWVFHQLSVAGQTGGAGGTTGAAPALALPTTGLRAGGGTGGAGLGATAVAGTAGGAITGAGTIFTLPGGTAGTAATTPPGDGHQGTMYTSHGFVPVFLGGTGGGSTHGSASGAGLRQSNGGDGNIGSGGGANGGAFTGSASGASRLSKGGPGLVVIWAF